MEDESCGRSCFFLFFFYFLSKYDFSRHYLLSSTRRSWIYYIYKSKSPEEFLSLILVYVSFTYLTFSIGEAKCSKTWQTLNIRSVLHKVQTSHGATCSFFSWLPNLTFMETFPPWPVGHSICLRCVCLFSSCLLVSPVSFTSVWPPIVHVWTRHQLLPITG